MRTFDDLRGEVLSLFDRLDSVVAAGGYAAPTADRRAAEARGRLADGRLTVVVCGEFKRGKSSLLGALLDEPDLFPADTLPATNAVTVVRWAPAESVTVAFAPDTPGDPLRTVAIDRGELPGYVTEAGNPGNRDRVVRVTIETPNPKLASGLVFVDTPGVGGVVDAHTAATLAFLPEADALLFVTDVEKPLLDGELLFLRRALGAAKLTGTADSLLTAVTKTDLTTHYATLLDGARSRIAALSGLAEDRVPVIPVSSAQKLDFLATGDPDALADSNFAALESELWVTLGRRRVPALLGGALVAFAEWDRALLSPIEAAERAAQDSTGRKLAVLRRQALDRRDRLDRLTKDGRFWESALNLQIKKASDRVMLIAGNELENNWARFQTDYVYDEELLHDPARLVDRLAADQAALLGGLLKLVRTEVAAAADEFSVDNGISVAAPYVGGLPGLAPPGLPDPSAMAGADKHGGGVVVLRNTAAAVGIGAVIGGVIGSFLLPGPGTAAGIALGAELGVTLGGALGGLFGYASSVKSMKAREVETQRNNIIRALAPSRAAQEKHLRGVLSLQFLTVRADAIAVLKDRVAQEKETAENVLLRLAADQKAAQAGLATEQARHAAERAPLDTLAAEAGALVAEVDALTAASGSAPAAGATPVRAPEAGAAAAPAASDDGGWADA